MKPLRVALIVKNSPACFERDHRNMGMWSYPVPEFTWTHFAPGKGKALDTSDFKRGGFDLIFIEDGGSYPDFIGNVIPNVFYSIDSTLSNDHHFAPRFAQARKADLVLVDHDCLERFEPCGRPVRRLLYCVNDRLFYPREKSIDVNFMCGGGSPERAAMRLKLDAICKVRGWSYRSGTSPLAEYAENMGRSKVVVIVPRTPTNRPHRLLDAMASDVAVLSAPLPCISGEHLMAGYDYAEFNGDLGEQLTRLLSEWGVSPESTRQSFLAKYSWSARAAELRQMLSRELGL